jgi:hypothetical protein
MRPQYGVGHQLCANLPRPNHRYPALNRCRVGHQGPALQPGHAPHCCRVDEHPPVGDGAGAAAKADPDARDIDGRLG